MARNRSRFSATPSLLDRLLPNRFGGEAGQQRPGSLAALEAALRRDLDTRRKDEPVPREFAEASRSLLTYGIPDFVNRNLRLSEEQERLRREIEAAIQLFEPRLSSVLVSVEAWNEAKPMLHFRIDALLHVEGDWEPVAFATALHSDTGKFVVEGQSA